MLKLWKPFLRSPILPREKLAWPQAVSFGSSAIRDVEVSLLDEVMNVGWGTAVVHKENLCGNWPGKVEMQWRPCLFVKRERELMPCHP